MFHRTQPTGRTPPADLATQAFGSHVVDRLLKGPEPGRWSLPGGELVLPRVFGFCRGVKRALALAERATIEHARQGSTGRLILLGEIIHNPWVNDHFRRQGVEILSREQRVRLDEHVRAVDCAIIPAFGVPLPIERRLGDIGSRTIDCTCGDVRRLWRWSEQAARDGFGVVVFGRSRHDETVVTKSRLADVGGAYLMLENLDQVRTFTEQLRRRASEEEFRRAYDADATNAACLAPFDRLAQVSQTTMLYRDTQQVREILHSAIVDRFGPETDDRLRFQPTVCRATQDRQDAAVELCRSGCDLVIVVGGFESSNTRHLHELAGQYAPAYLIENAPAIRSAGELLAYDRAAQSARLESGWLPARRRLRIGVLAGASSPEIVIGQVLERLAEFLT